jgi:hypothetical protein
MKSFKIIEKITSSDVSDKYAGLPTIKGKKCRTYFVVENEEDYKNICINVIKKFHGLYNIYEMDKDDCKGIFIVEK